nr:MAG TPA: protein of unknown function (DUF5320) [Caudoviricetes sp.]
MYAIKDNRQYKITEDEKQAFVDKGYKIAELKDNKLVFEKAKTKESEEIAKLKAENKKLEAELKKLKEEGK